MLNQLREWTAEWLAKIETGFWLPLKPMTFPF
jgi:hypothetical protein